MANHIAQQALTLTATVPLSLASKQIVGTATYVIANADSATVYLGTSNAPNALSSSNGIPIPAGQAYALTLDFQSASAGTVIWLLSVGGATAVTFTAFS